jgi:hypothetical protein
MSTKDAAPASPTGGRGRRRYHLRPEPRRRSDLMGFNSTWWMVVAWALVIVLIVLAVALVVTRQPTSQR